MFPLINAHTHTPRGGAIELRAVQTPSEAEGFCSVGLHPWRVGELSDQQIAEELEMVAMAESAAVGECGIDALRGGSGERQREVFAAQVEIAKRRGLPIIIHSVRSFEECMAVLRGHDLAGVVFHSWVGSAEQAAKAINRGYTLSVGPRSLASSRTAESLRTIADEALLVETDDSTTTIETIYEQLAELRGTTTDQLRATIYRNFTRIWPSGWNAPSCCSEPRN